MHGSDIRDIAWFFPDGRRRSREEDWHGPQNVLGVFLNGQGIDKPDLRGQRVVDDSFFLAFNGEPDPGLFRLPDPDYGPAWRRLLDTSSGWIEDESPAHHHPPSREIEVPGRSVQLFLRG